MNRQQYFDALNVSIRDCLEQLAQKPDTPFDAAEFVAALLAKMPPPAGVTLDPDGFVTAILANARTLGDNEPTHHHRSLT